MAGRPSSFKQEIADKICERIALGESLREICADKKMPDRVTVMRWLAKGGDKDDEFKAFRNQYARARELQADSLFEEMKEIADDGSNDWMEKRDKSGAMIGWQINGEAVQRSRLRLDDRRWRAAKLKPKKYGDRIDVTSGGDKIRDNLTTVEMAARLAAIASSKADDAEPSD